MEFFECRYYSMTRKLLLLIGQWPFQNHATRIVKHIFLVILAGSSIFVQFAKLMTPDLSINVIADIVVTQIAIMVCIIKYFTFTIQTKKIRLLLESIESDWKWLSNDDDRKIAQECAEEGRKYNFYVTVYLYSCAAIAIVPFTLQPFLDIFAPTNETREKIFLYPAEYFVDQQKYYSPITLHMSVTLLIGATVLLATDTLYVACIYHACGIFRVISHRLEHAFDTCKTDGACVDDMKSETRLRIASAVEYHQNGTQFVDVLISTFSVSLLLVTFLLFCDITISLYWAAISLGKLNEMLIALLFGTLLMIHAFIVTYPCQKVINDSSAIQYKAYCGLWYMAPFELQTLILPIIQRGGKPTMIYVVKIGVITMESYAKAIQMSLSYFTVLLSVV